jgi:hypothetical protein
MAYKHKMNLHLNAGGLHRALHVPAGQKIPVGRIQSAKNSSNAHVRKMATLALSMRKWHNKGAHPAHMTHSLTQLHHKAGG